jgi:hypothetical protein
MNTPFLTRHYRRTRLAAVTCLACVGLLLMGNVQAQWKVVDDAGNKHLQNIRDDLGERNGNVNKNLVNLYNQQKLGTAKSAGAIAKDPEELLDANSPSTVNIGIDDRCPETPTAGIAQQQHQICQEMVKTELAQYKYSLQMYQQAKDRHSRFQEIENDRSHLNPEDQGKLQDNSNKLLALISLMEIDRQQHRTYMDAYAARLHYMHTTQDLLTRWALAGDPKKKAAPWSSWVGDAALKGALDAVKTKHHPRD